MGKFLLVMHAGKLLGLLDLVLGGDVLLFDQTTVRASSPRTFGYDRY